MQPSQALHYDNVEIRKGNKLICKCDYSENSDNPLLRFKDFDIPFSEFTEKVYNGKECSRMKRNKKQIKLKETKE